MTKVRELLWLFSAALLVADLVSGDGWLITAEHEAAVRARARALGARLRAHATPQVIGKE
jgi:hypothetical protein